MKNISFENLNILQKFCDNQMNYEQFARATGYSEAGGYAEGRWSDFTKNPIRFITSRAEKDLLQYIVRKIEITKYKG